MTSDDIGGIVRTILAGLGGLLVTKGYIDQGTLTTIIGALVTIGTGVWSVIQKRQAASKLAAAVAAPAVKLP